jgi:hypothetical protein
MIFDSSIDERIKQVVQQRLDRMSNTIGPADQQLLMQLDNAIISHYNQDQKAVGQNTYLKDFEIPQIKLFDILANHFPLVLESQQMAHACLLREMKECHHLCIVDLGIGRSVQMQRLLQMLNEVPTIEKVTLIGVDIMHQALLHSEQLLEQEKSKLRFVFDFHLLHDVVERMDFDRVLSLKPTDHDFLYINASLTLHHVQQSEERNALFRNFKRLSPNLMTLIEPNTSTFTDDFDLRIDRAIEHFFALYDYTNTLQLKDEEKRSLKTFFGNDFYDPIANADEARFEKLERGEEWILRASLAGFTPFVEREQVALKEIKNIDLRIDDAHYTSFCYKGVDLLSLIHLHP